MSGNFKRSTMLVACLLATSWITAHASGYGYHHGYGAYHGHGYHNGLRLGFHGHADGELALGLLAGALIVYSISNHNGYRDYRPRRSAPVIPTPFSGIDSRCLQEREYQTTIIIDGEQLPAWGIVCLQPDGTWQRRGINLVP